MYSVSYAVSTPLVHQLRCASRDNVAQVIRDYMEGRSTASLERVKVVEVLGSQPLEDGVERDPSLFWP